ncbi:MAG: LysR family transcriptional regulator [Myxococcota bacterium]
MNGVQLRQIDLNLLIVLEVLLRERSVTRTAERLHLTPSAVSHALRRLRESFGDELLIRDGRRMSPTARAEGLAESVPRALRQLEQALAGPEPFAPEVSTRTFRLAAPDFIAPLVPHLLEDVGKLAPSVRVELAPYSASAIRDLADGRHDAVVAPSASKQEGVRSEVIGSWPWAVYGRRGHPAFDAWSLNAWSAFPHLKVAIGSSPGAVDRLAAKFEIRRVVGAVVPTFTMAAPILAQTDLLLTVPSLVMSQVTERYGLECREDPLGLPRMGMSMYRNAAVGNEPGVRWFLEHVAAAARPLANDAAAA